MMTSSFAKALLFGFAALAVAAPALAQRKPPEPAKKEEPAPEPKVEVEGKGAILQGLDKVTARISTLEANVGQTVTFGSLSITVRRCQRSRPDQKLERAAFLEIDNADPATKQKKRVFNGWMFMSNPAISALEHPVYDVWVKDCR
ncbi:MAG: DUF2155 domain-containing protein [Candidatus Odyssella sp.]|nr:DUF2155 domain-containing protein [Candidatus Odyssella sp.]